VSGGRRERMITEKNLSVLKYGIMRILQIAKNISVLGLILSFLFGMSIWVGVTQDVPTSDTSNMADGQKIVRHKMPEYKKASLRDRTKAEDTRMNAEAKTIAKKEMDTPEIPDDAETTRRASLSPWQDGYDSENDKEFNTMNDETVKELYQRHLEAARFLN
jgi:hypothetical protein